MQFQHPFTRAFTLFVCLSMLLICLPAAPPVVLAQEPAPIIPAATESLDNLYSISGKVTTSLDTPVSDATVTASLVEKGRVILLPGVMGSLLEARSKSGCSGRPLGVAWIDIQFLIDKFEVFQPELFDTLKLVENGTDAANNCDNVQPKGLIDTYRLLGLFDIYKSFAQNLENNGYTVLPFPYDWRMSIDDTVGKLDAFINGNLGPTGKVILVGHSMGGLVARAYVADATRAAKVAKVVTVGTPYLGAPQLAYVMMTGKPSLLPVEGAQHLLGPWMGQIKDLIRNAPGVLQLLPSHAYVDEYPYYMAFGTMFPDWEATNSWFAAEGKNQTLLAEAKSFHQRLDSFTAHFPFTGEYWILAARNRATPSVILQSSCVSSSLTCFQTKQYFMGDGSVPQISSRLMVNNGTALGPAILCTYSDSSNVSAHGSLMADPTIQSDLVRILGDSDPQGCSLPSQVQSTAVETAPSLREVMVWGDTDVRVEDDAGHFAGIDPSGLFNSSLPDVSMDFLPNATVVLLPTNAPYHVTARTLTDAESAVTIADFSAPTSDAALTMQGQTLFSNVPMAQGGALALANAGAPLSQLTLALDANADGTPEHVLSPTAVLTDPVQAQDTSMPTSTIALDGEMDEQGRYTGPITVTVAAEDIGGSGVLASYLSLDAGQTWQKYESPVQAPFGGASSVQAYSTDKVGNQEYPPQTHSLSFASPDTTKPTTIISVAGPQDGQGAFTGAVTVTVTATDSGSGVFKSYFSLDGGQTWQEYTTPLLVQPGQAISVQAYSVDKAGNQENPPQTQSLLFAAPDTTKPTTTISLVGPQDVQGAFTSAVTVTVTATDSGLGVFKSYFSLDGGQTWQEYTTLLHIQPGQATSVQAYSVDKAGNQENPPQVQSLSFATPDTTKPTTTIFVEGPQDGQGAFTGVVTVTVTATDSGSGVLKSYTSLDGGQTWQEFVAPVSVQSGQATSVQAYSVDKAGNQENPPQTRSLLFAAPDTTKPTTTILVAGPQDDQGAFTSAVTVTVTATDSGSGVLKSYTSLDGGQTWQEYVAPLQIQLGQATSVQAYSVDKAGNQENPPQTRSLSFATPDTTKPTTTILLAGSQDDQGAFTSAVTVTVTATDSGSGVLKSYTSLDGGQTWQEYVAPVSVQSSQATSVQAYSVDKAGNQENPPQTRSLSFATPDTTKPTTTILVEGPQDDQGAFTSAVTVTVTATDSGSGVLNSYFSLDGGQTWQEYTTPLLVQPGQATSVQAYSVDKVGNQENPSQTQSLLFVAPDTTKPTTTISVAGSQDGQGAFTGAVTVTVTATDSGSGVFKSYFSLDGGQTWQEYTTPLHIQPGQATSVQAYSVDKAGNQENPPQTRSILFVAKAYIYLPAVMGIGQNIEATQEIGLFPTTPASAVYTTSTGADGSYTLSNLPVGTYEVTVARAGWSFTPTRVTVTVPQNAINVNFTGTAPNHSPQANDDTSMTSKDIAVTINVLANDIDPDDDTLAITAVTDPPHGSAVVQGQAIRYTPDAGYTGGDSFTYTVSDDNLTDSATVNITVTNIATITNVFDDFSTYVVGSFPTGWTPFGSGQFTPTVQESGGIGSAFRVLDFQEVGWQYWDKFAIRDGIVAADTYTVQVKLRFLNSVADRAGLTIAWDRSNGSRIDIQPNVYNDNIEFRSSYGGSVNTLAPITIQANVNYWLRVSIENLGSNAGKISVYWSTNGATFTKVLEATGLSRVNGEVGVSTAGPHMPHTQFDDFQVSVHSSSGNDSLIAHYTFDGNANDISGNNHHSTVNGPQLTQDRFGNADSAFSFDGVNDRIIVPDGAGDFNVADKLTVSLWIKFHAPPAERISFVSKSSGAQNTGYIFPYYNSYDAGSIGMALHTSACNWCGIDNSYPYAQINQPLTWHLYAGTFDGRERKFYIDGQLVATDLQSDTPSSITANANDLVIGNQPGFPEWVNADLDDVRVYRRILTQSEIEQLFGDFTPSPTSGLNWIQQAPSQAPTKRTGLGMVYDSNRRVVVAFGGCPAECSDTTWEYDGVIWHQTETEANPGNRYRPALAYDSNRHVTVLFGGNDASGVWRNDTWEYDGVNWVQRQPTTSPPARNGASMTYDPVRQRMVLFGGYKNPSWAFYNDTWEYDGQNWIERAPATSPLQRETAGMAYAQHLGKVILFGGGTSAGSTMYNDTWAWDGENWQQLAPVHAPSARWGVNMTHDAARQKVVLFGGVLGYGTGLNDTWEFDGADWRQVYPAASPSVRWDVGLAFNTHSKEVVLFGGGNWNGPTYERFADTWAYRESPGG